MHILVIDDNESQFMMIEHMLTMLRDDMQLTFADNFRDGLQIGLGQAFDIMLIDYDLAGESGTALIRALRTAGINTPMILLTGHGNRDIDLEAMESGAVDYLDKGELRATTLERALRYALKIDRSMRQLRQSEARLQRVLTTMPGGVFIIAPEHLAFANDALCEMIGHPSTDLAHHHIETMLQASTEDVLHHLEQVEDPSQIEVEITTPKGAHLWAQITLTRMVYEERTAVLGVVADITQRKLAELIEIDQRTLAEALLDISTAIHSTLDLDDVLDRILSNLCGVISHDIASIMMIDGDMTRVVGYRGEQLEREVRKLRPNIQAFAELREMVTTKQPVLIANTNAQPLFDAEWSSVIHSYLGAPIIIADEVIGFINLFSFAPNFFTADHASRLQIFANQAVVAVRNAQAYEQAQERATQEERQRLARDLHDAVSQTLFSANVIAETLPRLTHDPTALLQGLERLSRMTKGALAEMRTLLLELRPAALIETDLSILLGHLVNATQSRMDANIRLVISNENKMKKVVLPPDVQVVLYRITQEALNNVVKHARATDITLTLDDRDDALQLTLDDNGRGFDPDTVPTDHLGLRIMRERAEKIEATLHILSQRDTGTRITVLYQKGTHHE